MKLSAVVITFNCEETIKSCLESITWCNEIIVVDSGSTDSTLTIVSQFNAKIIPQDWLGYAKQKQHGINHASYEWVLCVDSDECVSDVLRENILKALAAPKWNAYRMPRRNRFLGRWLAHGEGYPDWSLRLFSKIHAHWSTDEVHEKVICSGPIGTLHGDLLHYSADNLAYYLDKQNNYTSIQANIMYKQGKIATLANLLISPIVRFIKFYFFRLGFLDGIPGLVHISIGCFNSFIKYAKLIHLHQQSNVK